MKSLVSWCFSLLRSLSTRKTSFPRSGHSSNILSGLSGLLCSSKLEKASQPIQRLLSELLSGDGEIRTLDPLLARQVLSQLSYAPVVIWQPPTFPYRYQYSIIGRLSLNHRVRDENGCFPKTHRHQKFEHLARYFRA